MSFQMVMNSSITSKINLIFYLSKHFGRNKNKIISDFIS